MGEFDEVIHEFLVESREGLDQLDQDLVLLEERPSDRELLARIFRCAHTIKGTSGFLGLTKLEALTHAAESLLSKLRDGELKLNNELTTQLLATVDAVRKMLESVQSKGNDGESEYKDLIRDLKLLTAGGSLTAQTDESPALAAAAPASDTASPAKKKRARKPNKSSNSTEALAEPEAEAPISRAAEPVAPPPVDGEKSGAAPSTRQPDVEVETPPAAALHPASPAAAREVPAKDGGSDARAHSESVRVDVQLLDQLMDLAGELVLTRNQILQVQLTLGDAALTASAQRLNQVTIGLQDGIVRMRMQPIDNVLSKFPRMVRDVARACKKLVRVEIDGKNTELDKTLIESIKDPLTHLIRNAVDHGIESPEERVRKGKHPEGRILIRAAHRSGQVHVEISDDGAGIAVERVRQKAVDRGLVSAERATQMSDGELINLIFLPGFSTAAAVTNVSGRGVGMDVVKTNVERIGGAIEIESELGRGSTFRIKVPLTLAIVPALIVNVAGVRFAVPQVNLQELVLVDSERTRHHIERVHGAPVYRLRDKLLPLVFLSEQLGYEDRETCFNKRKVHIAVLQVGGRVLGLVVDQVSDQQEIVVKPLANPLKPLTVFAGATILGDGRVVLILDPLGIAQRANLVADGREDQSTGPATPAAAVTEELTSLLLMRGADDARLAVPLARVDRLETIDRSTLEEAGGNDVLQYGDGIMPIVHFSNLLPERRLRPRHDSGEGPALEYLNLVVISSHGMQVAMAVHDILDVVDVPLKLRSAGSRPGVTGTLVVQQRVTELLDLDWLVEQAGVIPRDLLEAG